MSPTGARPAALPSGVPAGLHATMLGFITTDAAVEARTEDLYGGLTVRRSEHGPELQRLQMRRPPRVAG
jgi:hypothetical protein